jgi:hypothetical protein
VNTVEDEVKGEVKVNGTIVGTRGRVYFKPEGCEEFIEIGMGDFLDDHDRIKHVGEDCLKPVDIRQHMDDVRQAMKAFGDTVRKQKAIEDQPIVKPRSDKPKRDWEQRNRKQRR